MKHIELLNKRQNLLPHTIDRIYCHTLLIFLCFISFPPNTNPDKGNSKPENSEILQTKHKDQLLYVCLIENFYPEVIRVQWVDGADKEVTKNVVKGDVWKSTNDKYSVSTWLTLPVNMTNKNYFCKYDHESQENFKLPIQGIYCFFIIYLFSFYILLCLFLSFFFFLLFEYN